MAYYDVNFITNFIRQEAIKRGIDPEVALRVARSEGLKANTWQSNWRGSSGRGPRETSYGPFQLLTGGGLGDVFEKRTGHQVEDPAYVEEQVRFALDEAARGGWTPWHGWKGARWAGIRTPATGEVAAGDVGGLARGSKMAAENYNALGETGEGGGGTADADTPQDIIGDLLGDELQGDEKEKPLSGLLGEMLKPPEMAAVPNLRPQGGGTGNVQSLPEYVQQYIAMRMRGQGGGMGGMGGPGNIGGQGLG